MASADQLIGALEGLDAKSFVNEAERVRAMDALTLALSKVQKPWDIVWQHCWVNPATNACVKTLIDAGVFSKWIETGGGEKTCAELAESTGADVVLVRRMIRQISGQNLAIETAEDTYEPTPWIRALAEDQALANVYGEFHGFVNSPMFRTLPAYLKKTGYKVPTNPNDCNWQFMRGSNENLFQSLGANPAAAREFNDAMESHSKHNLTPWVDVYPTETLVKESKPDRPLVVDVGGSKGHDLIKFHLRHPNIPEGSLVLQDLPAILKELTIDDTISIHPHDFFEPQPVKGARVYFMHNVLHDWEDTQAKQILSHLAEAMEPGYSKLLIHESLVSSVKPLARVTTSDITMMACLGAKERTEAEWRGLVESAGLKVLNIWRPPHSVESVIEAELA
ncbi:unnamed protein product [Alternaria alternata]